jgi:hypothetical protein
LASLTNLQTFHRSKTEKDYYKVFPKKKTKKEEKEEDRIYEVGEDGVDISS